MAMLSLNLYHVFFFFPKATSLCLAQVQPTVSTVLPAITGHVENNTHFRAGFAPLPVTLVI